MNTKIQAFFVLTDEDGAILTDPEKDRPIMFPNIVQAVKAQKALAEHTGNE